MNEHEDLELIAAFREGLLDPAASDRVAGHLSGCGVCAQRQTALGEVAAALKRAAPVPLPPSLAQRLDAALAAEVAATSAAAADASGSAAADVQREHIGQSAGHAPAAGRSRAPAAHARRRHARHAPAGRTSDASRPGGHGRPGRRLTAMAMRPLAAAAAVCLLAGGGYLLVNSLTHSAPGTSASGPTSTQPGKSGAEVSPHTHMYGPQVGTGAAASAVVHSQTRYRSGQLGPQAAAVASEFATAIPSPGKAGYTTVPPFGTNSVLAGCVQRVAGTQLGLIVDMASYDGHPATVIIIPRRGASAGHVWAVADQCSASASHILASATF